MVRAPISRAWRRRREGRSKRSDAAVTPALCRAGAPPRGRTPVRPPDGRTTPGRPGRGRDGERTPHTAVQARSRGRTGGGAGRVIRPRRRPPRRASEGCIGGHDQASIYSRLQIPTGKTGPDLRKHPRRGPPVLGGGPTGGPTGGPKGSPIGIALRIRHARRRHPGSGAVPRWPASGSQVANPALTCGDAQSAPPSWRLPYWAMSTNRE